MKHRYDKQKGSIPAINDRVVIIHSGTDIDGLEGVIGGWCGMRSNMIALVALDKFLPDGRFILAIPVGCLKPVD